MDRTAAVMRPKKEVTRAAVGWHLEDSTEEDKTIGMENDRTGNHSRYGKRK